ncbi:MAG: lipopolysaccharide biosynthesis protein [Brevundimonas sp.]|jgi:O-antigen/teichoic acid export membrane protein|uniref:lipopolysaccharide biosynthesis protein n=1 Tax=Brevundimonas sp. TaxID=1871086 RepID=UPI0040341419
MTSGRSRLLGVARSEKAAFVLVNVLVNAVFIARSYLTMHALDYRELGLAAVLQSIMLLMSVMHGGALNGGYRLLCSTEGKEAQQINNLIYTLLGGIGVAAVLVAVIAFPFLDSTDTYLVTGLGVGGGIATLVRTWMTNHMIARGALAKLNRINIWAALASIAPLAFIGVAPFPACLAAILAQPIAFVVAVTLMDRPALPTRLETSRALARTVLSVGFVVFLTGIFLQVNVQFERWYITGFLGIATLGHFYLAILFVTLFQMVPNALDQIFLPSLVRAHAAGDEVSVKRGMRLFFLIQAAYCALAAIGIVALAPLLLNLLLPAYMPDLQYVYLMAPGLIIFTLAAPLAIPFNVLIRYRYYFIGYGAGSLATVALFAIASLSGGSFDLADVALVRSAVYVLMAGVVVWGFVKITRDHPEFRFDPARRA